MIHRASKIAFLKKIVCFGIPSYHAYGKCSFIFSLHKRENLKKRHIIPKITKLSLANQQKIPLPNKQVLSDINGLDAWDEEGFFLFVRISSSIIKRFDFCHGPNTHDRLYPEIVSTQICRLEHRTFC